MLMGFICFGAAGILAATCIKYNLAWYETDKLISEVSEIEEKNKKGEIKNAR